MFEGNVTNAASTTCADDAYCDVMIREVEEPASPGGIDWCIIVRCHPVLTACFVQ